MCDGIDDVVTTVVIGLVCIAGILAPVSCARRSNELQAEIVKKAIDNKIDPIRAKCAYAIPNADAVHTSNPCSALKQSGVTVNIQSASPP